MPTYEYHCVNCGNDLEAVQKFTDAPLTVCPQCEGTLRKVFSPVGIVFKGSGFYRTDNKKTSSVIPAESPSTKPDAAKSSAKPESISTDSKPDAATAAKSAKADTSAAA